MAWNDHVDGESLTPESHREHDLKEHTFLSGVTALSAIVA